MATDAQASMAPNDALVTHPPGKWKACFNYVTGGPEYVIEPDPGHYRLPAARRDAPGPHIRLVRLGPGQPHRPATGTASYQYGNHHITLRTGRQNQFPLAPAPSHRFRKFLSPIDTTTSRQQPRSSLTRSVTWYQDVLTSYNSILASWQAQLPQTFHPHKCLFTIRT